MPLKIRCPHCQKTLVARDDTVGEPRRCPLCGKVFTVPLPRDAEEIAPVTQVEVATKCPRCGALMAPGTTTCRRCHMDVVLGKRRPFLQRLRRQSPLRTLAGLAVLAVLTLGAYVGVQVYFRSGADPAGTRNAQTPPARSGNDPAEDAAALLAAASRAERISLQHRLLQAASRSRGAVADALLAALDDSFTRPADWQHVLNQRVALRVLGELVAGGEPATSRLNEALERCIAQPPLAEAAWRVRGLAGDAAAIAPLQQYWQDHGRNYLFIDRFGQVGSEAGASTIAAAHAGLERNLQETGAALERLLDDEPVQVLGPLLETYWQSWQWLGDVRGVRTADLIFALAGQGSRIALDVGGFERQKQMIRAARDRLAGLAEQLSPTQHAAAGLVLLHAAPQYQSARERVSISLGRRIAESPPEQQQRLTWALARLTGRQFGSLRGGDAPSTAGPAAVAAAVRWTQQMTPGAAAAAWEPSTAEQFVPPLRLTRRVVASQKQLESVLLKQLRSDWGASREALDRWLRLELACGSEIIQLMDPTQRSPRYPAVAAAFVIAGIRGGQEAVRPLRLWAGAADQPAWVRQLAYTALAAIALRQAGGQSDWPASLTLTPQQLEGPDSPGWAYFGRIIAGEPEMWTRLRSNPPATWDSRVLTRVQTEVRESGAKK